MAMCLTLPSVPPRVRGDIIDDCEEWAFWGIFLCRWRSKWTDAAYFALWQAGSCLGANSKLQTQYCGLGRAWNDMMSRRQNGLKGMTMGYVCIIKLVLGYSVIKSDLCQTQQYINISSGLWASDSSAWTLTSNRFFRKTIRQRPRKL